MFSVRGIKSLFSTLRFRIVFWITLVVLIMVLGVNTFVRELEHRTVRAGYDEYLMEMGEQLSTKVVKVRPDEKDRLIDNLREVVKENEYRSLFVQLFDNHQNLLWGSGNAFITRPAPNFSVDHLGPYDGKRHRIVEKRVRTEADEILYVRCGFLQLTLKQDIELINRNILFASLFLVVLAPIGGYVIAWRATRPISQVIATATQLQPANLTERLPIRGTGDEIDQLSHTINGMLDRLASFINQNRDFVANAAHELRSPLTAIRTSVDVALNQTRTPEEYTVILAEVLEEVTRLAGLVNRLLILAEGDAGRLAARDQTTRLDKIVSESVEMFEGVAEMSEVRFAIGELQPALVRGDESNLRQVVRNLIDNAIKYNRRPGEVRIQLRLDEKNKQAVLSVQDTGAGIDDGVLPRIFERFYRADKSRTREARTVGYGLGLSICKTIVQALHGVIDVQSEIGRGTTFTVRLPLAEDGSALSQSGELRFAAAGNA